MGKENKTTPRPETAVDVERQIKKNQLTDMTYFARSMAYEAERVSVHNNCNEYGGVLRGVGETVASMTDEELSRQIAKFSEFVKNDPNSEKMFGSKSVLKGLQEFAWRRGMAPARPDWSVEQGGRIRG